MKLIAWWRLYWPIDFSSVHHVYWDMTYRKHDGLRLRSELPSFISSLACNDVIIQRSGDWQYTYARNASMKLHHSFDFLHWRLKSKNSTRLSHNIAGFQWHSPIHFSELICQVARNKNKNTLYLGKSCRIFRILWLPSKRPSWNWQLSWIFDLLNTTWHFSANTLTESKRTESSIFFGGLNYNRKISVMNKVSLPTSQVTVLTLTQSSVLARI